MPKEPITEFTLTLIVKGELEKSYSAATMLGDIPKNLVEFKNYETLTYTTPNILTSDYRWFWAVSDKNAPDPQSISSATIRDFNSKLGGFDSLITTNKMKSMCFFLPKARAKYNKESGALETSVEVLNDATGASACLEMLCQEVKVNDIGRNEHDYLMYYFTNDAPDSGTNTYEVIVNDLLEGGNS